MNIGIVGCGTMGKIYADNFASIEGVQIQAVCHYRMEQAKAFALKYGAHPYEDYLRFLQHPHLDAVCITLPTHLHKLYVIQALERKKHVICEKPLALDPIDGAAMEQACRSMGVHLFVAHVVRFFPEYHNVFVGVRQGDIGPLRVIHAKRASAYPLWNSWFLDEEKSGGVIFDLMIHDLDFVRWIADDPVESVYAVERKSEGKAYANATLRFSNGILANVEAMWGYPGPFTTQMEVAGRQGVIHVDNQISKPMIIRKTADADNSGRKGTLIPDQPLTRSPYLRQFMHFMDCIRSGATPRITVGEACNAVALAKAAAMSVKSGVPIPVEEFQ
ncbi:Gfo/Idh/MocA family oxidoreductase [Paenibacillus antri]|uniref:Gfo/Idh/MocA family oxidoreductase n=1 Tax=Paenibacillus antri TaxID=2582848 RepID=A0A5R9GFD7_9BACL|nr:Gfo/Idh/MocA family oxidoreductase [Paenibacillus antri]TLS53889.1 Gfo/Idh/MocA family oxidoreductase [Paenibacillus antri]